MPMVNEVETRRPKYWAEVEEKLSGLGYTLRERLSSHEQRSSSPSEVWLADCRATPEQEEHEEIALKLSSRVFSIVGGNIDDLEKLDELTQREVDIIEKINHPNIPDFRGYHRVPYGDGIAVIDVLAMQYIPMHNVLQGIKKGERIQESQAKRLLEDILSALDHVHTGIGEQVLHRDIKPSNVLFDGEKAFLFDFNFSKIGEATSSTFIVNNGYLPVDAFGVRQTPSQDLAALGNVVIAAALGKEIESLRHEQGKAGFEPVEVRTVPFSPKMRRFLEKLTAENPAFRYQSASQALQDLKNLEELTEEQLEKKTNTIVRSRGLERLLAALKKQDRLFEHNVPSAIRTRYDDDSLLEYLEQTYTQEDFVVEGPDEIDRYARAGDRVIKRGDFIDEKKILVKPGDIGIVKEDDMRGRALVKFKREKLELPYDSFTLEESTFFGTLLYTLNNEPGNESRISYNGRVGFKVKYTGEPILAKDVMVIPDGSDGIIFANPIGRNPNTGREHFYGYAIAWASEPGMKNAHSNFYYHDTLRLRFHLLSPEDIKLVVTNYINYQELQRQCFAEEQKQLKTAQTIEAKEGTIK